MKASRRRFILAGGSGILLASSLPLSAILAESDESDDVVIRRVAKKIINETKWSLTDTANGKTYDLSDDLPLSPTVRITSRFNEWYYVTLLVMEGMTRTGKVIDLKGCGDFSERVLQFVARHANWFRQEWDREKKRPDGIGRLGYYLNFKTLWTSGLAALWIEKYFASKMSTYQDYTDRFSKLVDACPRNKEGVLLYDNQIRTDDVYLMAPGMLRLGQGEKNAPRVGDSIQQALGAHRILFNQKDQLYCQSWDVNAQRFTGDYWGRGNGWMALAHVDLLSNLDKEHPLWKELLAAYREQMTGLRRWQSAEGGWRQLMDAKEAWIETSCTGMFTYAIARGVNEGWLDRDYVAVARLGWQALRMKARSDGVLTDICPATGQGQRNHYLSRPRAVDDVHGYGPFLLAGSEMLRLQKLF